jgi:hypothetical protein
LSSRNQTTDEAYGKEGKNDRRRSFDGFGAFFYNKGMVLVNLCPYVGILLALLGLRCFLFGPPDPTDDDERRGRWTPWG